MFLKEIIYHHPEVCCSHILPSELRVKLVSSLSLFLFLSFVDTFLLNVFIFDGKYNSSCSFIRSSLFIDGSMHLWQAPLPSVLCM